MTTPKQTGERMVPWRGAGRPELPAELIPVERIHPTPFPDNPRRDIGDVSELYQSIVEAGLLQPIVVRPAQVPCQVCKSRDQHYIIETGNRRFAAMEDSFTAIPCVIRPLVKGENLSARSVIAGVVENYHRTGLTPMERAWAFQRMRDEFGYKTVTAIAKATGLSITTVSNDMRLLELAPQSQEDLQSGKLTLADVTLILKRQRRAQSRREGKGHPGRVKAEPAWLTSTHELGEAVAERCYLLGHTNRPMVGHRGKYRGACGQCWQTLIERRIEAEVLERCASEVYPSDPAMAGRWRNTAKSV